MMHAVLTITSFPTRVSAFMTTCAMTTTPSPSTHPRPTRLIDALANDDLPDRHQQDPDVQEHRPVIDVPHIEREPLLPRKRVAAVDLRQTRDARQQVVPPRLRRCVPFHVCHEKRPGT